MRLVFIHLRLRLKSRIEESSRSNENIENFTLRVLVGLICDEKSLRVYLPKDIMHQTMSIMWLCPWDCKEKPETGHFRYIFRVLIWTHRKFGQSGFIKTFKSKLSLQVHSVSMFSHTAVTYDPKITRIPKDQEKLKKILRSGQIPPNHAGRRLLIDVLLGFSFFGMLLFSWIEFLSPIR